MPIISNKYRNTVHYIHVYDELVRAAQYRGTTTYQDLAVIMKLPLRGIVSHFQLKVDDGSLVSF